MKENFLDTADQILRFKAHRDLLVRKMVITMIPSLAGYDTQTFTEHFLHKAMAHLLTQLEKPNERSFGKPTVILLQNDGLTDHDSLYCHWAHCYCRWKRHETIP